MTTTTVETSAAVTGARRLVGSYTGFVSEHDDQRNPMAATAVPVAIPVSAFFHLVQKNLVPGPTTGGTKG